MPRDGSNIYSYPVGTRGEPDTTIESAKYNSYIDDVQQDLNIPRPIVSGGTGANNALDAINNLRGEIARQVITNYDLDAFHAGSFYSASTATAGPVDGHAFVGIAYKKDDNNLVLEARDQNDTRLPGKIYIREKKASVWSAWTSENYVEKTGSMTMEGPLTIDPVTGNATINLVSDPGTTQSEILGYKGTKARWIIVLGDASPESTGNAGSNFVIASYDDAGALLNDVLKFTRSTGLGTVKGPPTEDLGIATKGFTDAAIAAELARANGAYQPKDPQLFAGIPPVHLGGNYTTIATDAQKLLCNAAGGAITATINGALYPMGTVISFFAYSQYMVINNTEAMQWRAPAGPTGGNRTLGHYGVATVVKWTSGNWVISGNGLT